MATGSCACTGSASGSKPNLTDRFAGNLRKAIGIPAKDPASRSPAETEAAQAAAQSAEALVQVALAAFAVSAYIRSSLCPSLQSYEPQAKLPPEVKLSAPACLMFHVFWDTVMSQGIRSVTITLYMYMCTRMQQHHYWHCESRTASASCTSA